MKDNKNDSFLDRVILHNKNADERLFDMILRFITFVVLIIILWLYADFTRVRADSLHFSNVVFGENPYNFSMYLNSGDALVASNNFDFVPYNSTYSQFNGYGNYDPLVIDGMDLENNYFLIAKNITSGSTSLAILFVPKDYIYSGDFCLIGQSGVYAKDSFELTYFTTDTLNLNTSSSYTSYTRSFISGYVTLNQYFNSVSANWIVTFSNIPMLKGSSVNQTSADAWLLSKENQLFSCFNANYVSYDGVSNLPILEYVESSKNHLALSDCQIGITAFDKAMTDLSESSVVIGLACEDNWILSHINDYNVLVQYDFYLKDSNLSQSDPVTMYTQTYPLAAFKIEPITESMANIMVNSMVAPFPSNRDFYSYYRSLNSTYGQKVTSERTFNYDGLIPTLINSYRSFFIGSYSTDNEVTSNNTIFEFYLDVNVRLSAQGESGGYYTKRFDFKRGTTSIISADAYQNPDPWEGESTPESEIDPYVPSGSSSAASGGSSAVAYGGNVTIYNNNNNSLVGSGSDTDTDTGIDNFLNVFNTFKSSFNEMSSVGTPQDNGFMGFLQASFGFIPGLNYIVICVGVVFSLIIILVIIRSLLL